MLNKIFLHHFSKLIFKNSAKLFVAFQPLNFTNYFAGFGRRDYGYDREYRSDNGYDNEYSYDRDYDRDYDKREPEYKDDYEPEYKSGGEDYY